MFVFHTFSIKIVKIRHWPADECDSTTHRQICSYSTDFLLVWTPSHPRNKPTKHSNRYSLIAGHL